MKISFATCDWAHEVYEDDGLPVMGGSGHARMLLPSRYLRRHGHTTQEGVLVISDNNGQKSLGLADHEKRYHGDCDVLVLQRYMDHRVPQALIDYKKAGGKVINDIDDHFWKLDPRNNAAWATDPRNNKLNNRDIYKEVLGLSDLVTVTTEYLYREIKQMCPGTPVLVVENAVDVERYQTRHSDDKGDKPTFGWVGAQAWRSGDLEYTADFIGPFLREHDLPFHHSGVMETNPEMEAIFELYRKGGEKAVPIENRVILDKINWFKTAGEIYGVPWATSQPMCRISEYPAMFDKIDVSLVPLNPVAFNLGKSQLKGIESAAAGIPFIASRFGEYITAYEKHGLGMIPDGSHKTFRKEAAFWRAKLDLMLNPQVRQEEREKNFRIVKDHYDMETRWKDWESIYSAVARGEKVG